MSYWVTVIKKRSNGAVDTEIENGGCIMSQLRLRRNEYQCRESEAQGVVLNAAFAPLR